MDAEGRGGRSREVTPPVQNHKESHLWVPWTLFYEQNAGLRRQPRLCWDRIQEVSGHGNCCHLGLQPSSPAKRNLWAPQHWPWAGAEGRNKGWSLRAGAPPAGAGHIKGSRGCQFPFSLEWWVLSNPEALFKG